MLQTPQEAKKHDKTELKNLLAMYYKRAMSMGVTNNAASQSDSESSTKEIFEKICKRNIRAYFVEKDIDMLINEPNHSSHTIRLVNIKLLLICTDEAFIAYFEELSLAHRASMRFFKTGYNYSRNKSVKNELVFEDDDPNEFKQDLKKIKRKGNNNTKAPHWSYYK